MLVVDGFFLARVPRCCSGVSQVHGGTWSAGGAPGEGPPKVVWSAFWGVLKGMDKGPCEVPLIK